MLCHPKPSVQDGVSKLICPRISHPFQFASALDRDTRIEKEGEIHNGTTQALASVYWKDILLCTLVPAHFFSAQALSRPSLTFFQKIKCFQFFFFFLSWHLVVYVSKPEATKLKTEDYCDTRNVLSHKTQDYGDTLNVS